MSDIFSQILWPVIGLIFLLVFASGIRIIRPFEMASVETLGKFKGIKTQGITYIIPFIQKMFRVSIAEALVDVEPQEVITKDNLNAKIDAQVYYKVKELESDVYKALYKAEDYKRQIINLARTTLRDVIGNMMFEDANKQRNQINQQLQKTLEKESDSWGIQIVRTEIAEIEPPSDVQQTMNEILKANNTKVAALDFAQAEKTKASGVKMAEIEKAEGDKKSAILRAEGQAQAIKEVADANAQRIKVVNESAKKYFEGNAQDLKKLETAESALKKGTKYIVPEGSDLVNVVSDAVGLTPVIKKK